MICEREDCSGKHLARGMCSKCYARWYYRHKRKEPRIINCAYCGKEIETYHATQRFCSPGDDRPYADRRSSCAVMGRAARPGTYPSAPRTRT